jgi:hypothetical protein
MFLSYAKKINYFLLLNSVKTLECGGLRTISKGDKPGFWDALRVDLVICGSGGGVSGELWGKLQRWRLTSIHPKHSAMNTTVVTVDAYEVDEDDGLLLLRTGLSYCHTLYLREKRKEGFELIKGSVW